MFKKLNSIAITSAFLISVIIYILPALNLWSDPAGKKNRTLNICIINLREVFDNYEEIKKLYDALKEAKEKRENELRDLEKKIEDHQADIKRLQNDDSPHAQKLLLRSKSDLVKAEALRKYYINEYYQTLEEKLSKKLPKLYNKIRDAINLYAEQNKYDLILKIDEPHIDPRALIDPRLNSSFREQVDTKVVLYAHPDLDKTREFIIFLNNMKKK